jgi:hypothetical protein
MSFSREFSQYRVATVDFFSGAGVVSITTLVHKNHPTQTVRVVVKTDLGAKDRHLFYKYHGVWYLVPSVGPSMSIPIHKRVTLPEAIGPFDAVDAAFTVAVLLNPDAYIELI